MTGRTFSSDYPTTQGAFDSTLDGGQDAFVTKLNATGSALAYSTFLGGTNFEEGLGIAEREGRVYVTGDTDSFEYPTTPGTFDTTYNDEGAGSDAFVTKLPTG